MAAIQIDVLCVDLVTDRIETVFEHTLQTAVVAPLAEVIIDGLPADFFFSPSLGTGSRDH